MEERYWVRHPSLREHVGPLTREELRARFDTETMPRDSYALPDGDESKDQRDARPDWRPVSQVLGLQAAGTANAATPPSKPPSVSNADRREHLRIHTAYVGLRFLIVTGMTVLVIGEVVVMFALLSRSDPATSPLMMVLSAIVTLVIGLSLLALVDIADCHIQKVSHPREET